MTMPREIEDQWWVLQGDNLMYALRAAHEGTRPEIVYLELVANGGEPADDDQ